MLLLLYMIFIYYAFPAFVLSFSRFSFLVSLASFRLPLLRSLSSSFLFSLSLFAYPLIANPSEPHLFLPLTPPPHSWPLLALREPLNNSLKALRHRCWPNFAIVDLKVASNAISLAVAMSLLSYTHTHTHARRLANIVKVRQSGLSMNAHMHALVVGRTVAQEWDMLASIY